MRWYVTCSAISRIQLNIQNKPSSGTTKTVTRSTKCIRIYIPSPSAIARQIPKRHAATFEWIFHEEWQDGNVPGSLRWLLDWAYCGFCDDIHNFRALTIACSPTSEPGFSPPGTHCLALLRNDSGHKLSSSQRFRAIGTPPCMQIGGVSVNTYFHEGGPVNSLFV